MAKKRTSEEVIAEMALKLETLTSDELDELEVHIEDERARRARKLREQDQRNEERRRDLLSAAREYVGEWVYFQYRQCSSIGCKCRRSKSGGHGPYWYLYFEDPVKTGRRGATYIGRKLKSHGADVLAAHEAKRAARQRLVTGGYRELSTADELVGLYPEEVYPEEFSEERIEAVVARRERERAKEAQA